MTGSTHYERAVLHVLSGTGNSLRVAEWMRQELAAAGTAATVALLNKRSPASGGAGKQSREKSGGTGGDGPRLEGFLFPTHGFTAPWLMIRHVISLPRARGASAFVSACRAGWWAGVFLPGLEGTAAYLIALLLVLKDYRVRGVMGIDMPTNWIAAHPPLGRQSIEHFLQAGRAKAARFIGRIAAGRACFGLGSFVALALGLLLLPVSAGYLIYGRFLFAKLLFASARCNGCGSCAAHCPAAAIRMRRARPYWTYSCESCMRCLCFCPQRAVEAGHSWAALLVLVTAIPLPIWAADWLLGHFGLAWLGPLGLHRVAHYVYFLLSMLAAYWVFWLAIRLRPFNALFTYTTFTHLWGRYHEPGTTLSDFRQPRD